ncbi:hypothetical protein CBS147355_1642 [Penicillium roqueforti]|nr:hypothetical protein CBS147355_1642 [Penicillium roqueforti]
MKNSRYIALKILMSQISGLTTEPRILHHIAKVALTRSSLYFTPERKLFNEELGGVRPGKEPLILEEPSIEESFDRACPDFDEEEAHEVKALLRWILQYDPAKRPSPAEILSHPWFCKIEVESGSSKVNTV